VVVGGSLAEMLAARVLSDHFDSITLLERDRFPETPAAVLEHWLREELSHHSPGRGRVFQRRLARVTAAAWQLSAGADYGFRTTQEPPRGRIARLTGCYFAAVMRAATRQPWARRRLTEVLHLLRPPSALFGPGLLARLAWERLAGKFGAGSRRGGPAREGTEAGGDRRDGVELSPEWTIEEGSRA
jgi:hypothetical protein